MNASDAKPAACMRLDQLLAATGAFESRARDRDAILRGAVAINGDVVIKPSARYSSEDSVEIRDAARGYVSRAALKLIVGLDHFSFDPAGHDALDIGVIHRRLYPGAA